jgi:release factor glutamine methyltransferase
MTSIAELLLQRERLIAVSDTAALDVELLLCHCLQKSRSYLRGWPTAQVPLAAEQQFQQLLQRREQGEPIAYLMGERGFWNLDLAVSPATLIPRPETELLVEKSLQLFSANVAIKVLDLGTGTGAIALALASERSQWHITACDVEPAAVALAEKNRKKYQLDNVLLLQSDWFSAVGTQRYDLIVSNPPYIDATDIHLQQGDVRFEPRSALVSEDQGLAAIKKIVDTAPEFITPAGWLLLEHGYNQAQAVRAILRQAGFDQVFTEQDLAGMDRVSGGQFTGR